MYRKFKETYIDAKNIYFSNENINLLVSEKYYDMFSNRVNAEKKFRKIVKLLIDNNIIDKNKNMIDLGAWIGDNSLIWSQMINGIVYAIDPSSNNINIINTLKKLNNINNIKTIQKPISDKLEKVSIDKGDINHGSFKSSEDGIRTETLDNLYKNKVIDNIGFIHLDVEGFEYKVVKGSQNIISTFRPIIVTESHKNDIDVGPYISKHNYEKYTINEICGASASCRNTVWIPNEIDISNIKNLFKKYLET